MGRIIQGATMVASTPLVQIREKGRIFVGTKVGSKAGKKPGSMIFNFKIEDGTTADTVLSTGQKDAAGKNIYAACDVDLGDEVALFGDTQLNDKLGKVNTGEKVKITSNGKAQSPKTGNFFNDYVVEVL